MEILVSKSDFCFKVSTTNIKYMSFILAIEQYRHLKVSQKGTAFTVFAKAFNRTLRQRRSTHKRRRARSITVRALPGTAFLSQILAEERDLLAIVLYLC